MNRCPRPLSAASHIATWLIASVAVVAASATPVTVTPVNARHGMVVAGHPQAAEIGVAVLQAGGNAVDAAVATSLALGVAEPYGSGLGGKLMLLYYDAASGRTFAVDAMDAAGAMDVAAYLQRPESERSYGYGAVCVPGLAAGWWAAHQRWGKLTWAEAVEPAIRLARAGALVLPKNRDLFAEQEKKLRRGDPDIARLYLPGGELPEAGTRLLNEDLARTMERLAREGRDGFYRGPVAEAMVAAAQQGGGWLTLEDFARYEARITEPITAGFRGYTLHCAPPPTSGAALFLPMLKVLEPESFGGEPLRSAANLERIGRAWRAVIPQVARTIADVSESRFLFEKLLAADSIAAMREKAFGPAQGQQKKVAWREEWSDPGMTGEEAIWHESLMASTTHFVVVDAAGNIVCATQSQSLHFGAGVVPPGTGVVMNNSASNFTYSDSASINYPAPGKRPRSTIGPTIVLRDGRPVLAIGIPGAARIPTALLQALLDRLALDRPLEEAIGDTRIHFHLPTRREDPDGFAAEKSLPAELVASMQERGWKVTLPEAAGTGRYFGGINAVEIKADGTRSGYADPRRTNVALGY